MKYTLNFSLKLQRDDSYIIYDPETFVESPISVSVPDIVKIFEEFIKDFEEVGITEKASNNTNKSKKDNKSDSNLASNDSQELSVVRTRYLVNLSGKAYICKSKELDQSILDKFSLELIKYIHDGCSRISPDNFLAKESSLFFSGLREVLELHRYLAKYTKSRKKMYQNGYLYIMPL
ncbi:MAG: hypothetical protein MH252_15485 [Thermosynechococcaceae cyanobacterium MS004]|nr:hypothetical protein [Thermosynechococcaceae cyanobacterium MS004]